MSVVAIINRKGGCGKSTLAAHLAVWLSHRGQRIMLADVDHQQSIVSWLQRRRAQEVAGEIQGWITDSRNVLRPPAGVMHSVMDTPGGIHGFELARLLVFADIVLMPICDSAFDYDAAAACLAEMRTHPRVANGRARIAAVGMRILPRSAAEQRLRDWAADQDVEYLGTVRPSQVYVRCAASGLTAFDLPPLSVANELAAWQPLLGWLDAALEGSKVISLARRGRPPVAAFAERQVAEAGLQVLPATLPRRPLDTGPAPPRPDGPQHRASGQPPGLVRRVLGLLPSFGAEQRVQRAP